VTVSTNMAGRGTDIRLGGVDGRDRENVAALGGLYVLGANRHESRRVDDQLRGRAGRQGDPGSTRFIISLEDDLLARCGIERLLPEGFLRRAAAAGIDAAGEPIDHPAVRREVARVQRIVEGQHGDIRRQLLKYSRVLEHQRGAIQEWRQAVLEGEPSGVLAARSPRRWQDLGARCGESLLREVERRLTLLAIDRCWSEHLAEMQALRDEIHLVRLDGRDPLTEFYRTAGTAFATLRGRIEDAAVETFERLAITAAGVDWEGEGLRGPSSTWTYMINDEAFAGGTFQALANRASLGLWAVLLTWPLLFVWGLAERWRRRRAR